MHNIIMVVVDCLRADRVAGRGFAHTPSIRTLVKSGVNFTQTIASNTHTTPCFSNLLTGCFSTRHGVRTLLGVKLNQNLPTLPECLGKMGYHTIAEVTGPLLELTGLDRGFQDYHYRSEKEYLKDGWGKKLFKMLNSDAWPKPFFLMVHLWELHMERQMLPGYNNRRHGRIRYDRALSSLDSQLASIFEAAKDSILILTGDHGETFPETRLREIASFLRWDISKSIRRITGRFGRKWPRHEKRWGHGVGLGLMDELVRIPFVLSAPGLIPEGVTIDRMVRQVDILPTILDLAGGLEQWEPKGHGTSLRPLLEGKEMGVPPVYLESAHSPRIEEVEGVDGGFTLGIQNSRYKMVFDEGSEDDVILYDVNDLTEPLADTIPDYGEIVEELKAEMGQFTSEHEDGQKISKLNPTEGDQMEARLRDLGYL